jgi:pilus assembly protein Flp/PilA
MFEYMKAAIDLYFPQEESDELEGQGMVEYGLILALVSVVAIAALILLGDAVFDVFTAVTGALGIGGGEGA